PLMGGFVAREMISAGAIHAGGLAIPLVGLAWAGDAVLALAILRATAPAFTDLFARGGEPVDQVTDDETADDDEAEIERDEQEPAEAPAPTRVTLPRLTLADLRYTPGVIFAALALVIGIAPQLLLRFGATLAGNALLTSSGLDGATRVSFSGYISGTGQWLPTLSWLGVVVLVALLAVVVPRGSRVAAPALAPEAALGDDEDRAREMAGLAEPVDAWDELAPAMQSMWTLPGSLWLLAGTDEDEEPPVLANDDEDDEDLDEFEPDEPEPDEPEPDEVIATIAQQANNNSADASDGRRRGRRSGENV
ncbi:MAG: hypothetical protein ACRDHE_18295, partial [Ktedonobacterales bacterium]